MFYLISTIPLEQILNSQNIPSPLIIRHHTRKSVMLSVLPNHIHTLYMAYGQPIYTYIFKDNWFQNHLSHLGETYDTGILKDLPTLVDDYKKNKELIQKLYPYERLIAFSQEQLYEQVQEFGKTHTFKNTDYYGFVLEDYQIKEV